MEPEVRTEVERLDDQFEGQTYLVRLYHWPSGRTVEAEASEVSTAREAAEKALSDSLKEPYRRFPRVIRC